MEALNVLQKDLEKAESSLKSVDSKIKETTGFDPNERRTRVVSRVGVNAIPIRRTISGERRLSQSDDAPGAKRFRGPDSSDTRPVRRTVQMSSSVSSSRECDERAPPIQSSVVRSVPERPPRSTRQTDPHSMARNRRMFGMLMGTLQKFKSDDSNATTQSQKQKEIDARLEETRKKDREETVRQREELYRARREQSQAVNQIKSQIELVELQKQWVAHKDELRDSGSILTKARPSIFYSPAVHTRKTEKLVEETQRRLDEEATSRHEALLSSAKGKAEEETNDREQQRATKRGSAITVPDDEDGLTFDAAADGITGLPGVEEEDASADVKVEDDEQDSDGSAAKADGAVKEESPDDRAS
ncbi:pinin-like [Sycon ciliatum]|uniref:pinin-like n=1 Tax=Sycon ciliatum TaxID=27933 RepID=UPI0020AAB1AB|eukprot:scpid63539/ scgid28434/ Pinin